MGRELVVGGDADRVASSPPDAGAEVTTSEVTTSEARIWRALDPALDLAQRRATARVSKLGDRGDSSLEALHTALDARYLRAAGGAGAAVGLTAAVPGLGTGAAIALTSANVVAFAGVSALHVVSVAQLHGHDTADLRHRRALVLAALLGSDATEVLSAQFGLPSAAWGRQLLSRLPISTVASVNRMLAMRAARLVGAKGGVMAVGRLAPFGIGGVVGWGLGRAAAREIVSSARTAFAPDDGS